MRLPSSKGSIYSMLQKAVCFWSITGCMWGYSDVFSVSDDRDNPTSPEDNTLRWAIEQINSTPEANNIYINDGINTITLNGQLPLLQYDYSTFAPFEDNTLSILSNNTTPTVINGNNQYRGLFLVGSPSAANFNTYFLENLKFTCAAIGGDGGGDGQSLTKGGGGGGIGGALFVQEGAIVTATDCVFENNLARGGNGGNGKEAGTGQTQSQKFGGAGGGGLHGNGKNTTTNPSQSDGGSGGNGGGGIFGNGGAGQVGGNAKGGGGGAFSNGAGSPSGTGADGLGGDGGSANTNPAVRNGKDGVLFGGGGGGSGAKKAGQDGSDGGNGGNGGYGAGGGGGGGLGTGNVPTTLNPGTGGEALGVGGGGGGGGTLRLGTIVFKGASGGQGACGGGGGGAGLDNVTTPLLPVGQGGFAGGNGSLGGIILGQSSLLDQGPIDRAYGGSGGGGGALGGAIFIDKNAVLNLEDPIFINNSLQAGSGGSNSFSSAEDGQTYGVDIFVLSSGSITFSLTKADVDLENPIEGDIGECGGSLGLGGLDKSGTYRLGITGENTYSGQTTVNQGELQFLGSVEALSQSSPTSVITPVSVANDNFSAPPILSGNGIIKNSSVPNAGNLTVAPGGTVSPGINPPTVNSGLRTGRIVVGNTLNYEEESTYIVDISPVAQINDIIEALVVKIEEPATATPPQLIVRPLPGAYTVGNEYDIITYTEALTGAFPEFIIEGGPTGLQLELIQNEPGRIFLRVIEGTTPGGGGGGNNGGGGGSPGPGTDPPGGGGGGGDSCVCCNLIGLPLVPGAPLTVIYNLIGALDEDLQRLVCDELSPGANFGSLELLNLDSVHSVGRFIQTHLFEQGEENKGSCGKKQCRDEGQGSFWAHPFGYLSNNEKIGDLIATQSNVAGVLVGADVCVDGQVQLGTTMGYYQSRINVRPSAGTASVQSAVGSVFAGMNSELWFVDGALLGGFNYYKVDRAVRFSVLGAWIDEHAKSEHYGAFMGVHLGALCRKTVLGLTPFTNVDWVYLYQEEFTERGSDVDLHVRDESSSIIRTEIGLAWIGGFAHQGFCMTPRVQLSWVSKIPIGDATYESNFVGFIPKFKSKGYTETLHLLGLTAGLKMQGNRNTSLLLNYRGEYNNKSRLHEADIGLEWVF